MGYVHVFHSCLEKRVGLRCRKVRRDCLVEEYFRTRPPRPSAVDRHDGLGLSDTIIRGNELAGEIDHLDRSVLQYLGRALRIEWADEPKCEEVRS